MSKVIGDIVSQVAGGAIGAQGQGSRQVIVADNNRYAQLDNTIIIPAGDDWETTFQYLYYSKSAGGGAQARVWGDAADTTRFVINDPLHPTDPNTVNVRAGVSIGSYANAFSGVNEGDTVLITLVKSGSTLELYINGVEITRTGGGDPDPQQLNIDQFYTGGTTGKMARGAAMWNFKLTNTTTGDTYIYALGAG